MNFKFKYATPLRRARPQLRSYRSSSRMLSLSADSSVRNTVDAELHIRPACCTASFAWRKARRALSISSFFCFWLTKTGQASRAGRAGPSRAGRARPGRAGRAEASRAKGGGRVFELYSALTLLVVNYMF